MIVAPGSAFFQIVQGSAANATSAGTVNSAQQSPPPGPSPAEPQRFSTADIQMPENLRSGPPGTNLNIVV